MADIHSPFQTLLELAQRSRRCAQELPSQTQIQAQWSGIGFTLMGHQFVAPIGEVSELLEVPGYTQLPGVKHWVMGVANVRGQLMPLINLAAFLGGRLEMQRKHHRVLVLESGDLYTGLVVDQSLGMQHFLVSSLQEEPDIGDDLKPFVTGAYANSVNDTDGGRSWFLFSPYRLSESPNFFNVAN